MGDTAGFFTFLGIAFGGYRKRSALDSIHQNHLGREGLRWNNDLQNITEDSRKSASDVAEHLKL